MAKAKVEKKEGEEKEKKELTPVEKLEQKYGKGVVIQMDDDTPVEEYEVISTGSIGLDRATGIGGVPLKRMVEIYGPESCLDEETFIQYEIRTSDGKRQNHKGGTIKTLYERFNKLPRKGKGCYLRPESENSQYFASCMNEEGRIFQNRIEGVFSTGIKQCYEITTLKGYKIIATAEHKFFTGVEYLPVAKLSSGTIIMIHNSTPFKKEPDKREYYEDVFTKNHPVAGTKVIDGRFVYSKVRKSRLVYEAYMNGLTLEQIIGRLEANQLEGLKFLSREDHIHHIDEDIRNNDISNLVMISASEHGRLHAMERHNNLRYTVIPDEIISIEQAGERNTYDIRMTSPFNNYVANNFVVHNSGKSTIATHIIANAQMNGGRALYQDVEHTFDLGYAINIGIQRKLLTLGQAGTGEECFDVLKDLIKTGDYRVAVLDSVAAAIPKEQHIGETGHSRMSRLAALMSLEIPKLVPIIADGNCVLIFINQLRSNISGYGNPEQPAGGNSLKFYASMRMDVRKIIEREDGRNKTTVKLIKNKCSPPFREATFYVDWGIGINRTSEILDECTNNKWIEKAGSWYTFKSLETQEELTKLQGEDKAIQFLNDNPEMLALYEQKVKEVLYG